MNPLIDEAAARACKHAMSFSEYREGSATAEYDALCAQADEIAAAQKEMVHPSHHQKIDRLLASYKHRMAENINARNRNGASCPSVMIAGPSNFPVGKKERQNARENTLMHEYDDIVGLLDKIRGVGTGGIQSGDVDALERLQEKLDSLRESHAEMIARNKHWRKHGTMAGYKGLSAEKAQEVDAKIMSGYSWERCPAPSYTLQSSNAEMKRLEGRIEDLRRAKEQPPEGWVFDGGRAECDTESMRLQLFFDEKPDEALRAELKSNGFRWAPSVGAWQRLLNNNALYAARRIKAIAPAGEALKE